MTVVKFTMTTVVVSILGGREDRKTARPKNERPRPLRAQRRRPS